MTDFYESVELFYEPVDSILWENFKAKPEMTRWESAFLSGLE